MINAMSDTWTPVHAGSHVVYKSDAADGQAGGQAREQASERVGGREGKQTSERACEPASEQTDRWASARASRQRSCQPESSFQRKRSSAEMPWHSSELVVQLSNGLHRPETSLVSAMH